MPEPSAWALDAAGRITHTWRDIAFALDAAVAERDKQWGIVLESAEAGHSAVIAAKDAARREIAEQMEHDVPAHACPGFDCAVCARPDPEIALDALAITSQALRERAAAERRVIEVVIAEEAAWALFESTPAGPKRESRMREYINLANRRQDAVRALVTLQERADG